MKTPAVCCGAEASLNEAARLMWEHDVGVVVITDQQGQPIAMITDRDICMAAYTQGVPLFAGAVTSAMSRSLVSVRADAPLGEVYEALKQGQVRRVPVVDDGGRLVGLVGWADLARAAGGGSKTNPMLTKLMEGLLLEPSLRSAGTLLRTQTPGGCPR
jgi:predicted transcriptional regulator